MRKLLLALALLAAVSSSGLPVDEMLARFNKVKQKSKHRHGVENELYVNVHSELAPGRSGSYEATDCGRTLTLEVQPNGAVTGGGAEERRTFAIRDGRVDGSHLTATKQFADGTTEPLEGIFIHQRRRAGRTAEDIATDRTVFGLGVTGAEFTCGGMTVDKLFYERK